SIWNGWNPYGIHKIRGGFHGMGDGVHMDSTWIDLYLLNLCNKMDYLITICFVQVGL
ncbi:hypothetical protein BYT27DRAFT_7119265, partial [Phlegmacium glaucopus]